MKKIRVTLMLILGAIGAIPLIFLTPPFQAPDEVQHFYRAYQLSELQLHAEVQNGVSGGELPDSLPELVNSSVTTPDGMFYPPTPSPLSRTPKLASIQLNDSARRFIAIRGSAGYSPLPYLPQILGISIGRWFGLAPLYLLYLGRIFNCLTALGIVGLAVYLMPEAGELVMVVGLLPMALYLFASLSPDAAVISCALLFTALSFSASTRGEWKTWELALAAVTGAVLCSVKPVYAPMLITGVVPGLLRRGNVAKLVRSYAILLAVALGVAGGWLMFANSALTSSLGAGQPSLQLSAVFHHPTAFMYALVNFLGSRSIFSHYIETVGWFGWLTVPLLPTFFFVYLLPIVNFFIVWAFGNRVSRKRSILSAVWYLALAAASAFLIILAMYLVSTSVGGDQVLGVQGRYFIPILVLAGMAVIEMRPGRRPSAPSWRSLAWIAAIIAVQIIAMDATIIHAFHVFS